MDAALDNLMTDWDAEAVKQKADLVAQVRRLANAGDLAGLADLSVSSDAAALALADAMGQLAHWAADQAAQENGGEPAEPNGSLLDDVAIVTAAALAAELAVSASRAALSAIGTGQTPDQVADRVEEYLGELSDAGARRQLGGNLHGAINAARLATFEAGPVGALYAHEMNDRNTCVPCHQVNGRFLGTTNQIETVWLSYPEGAYGGYVLCQGGPACRGTVFGVWREGAA